MSQRASKDRYAVATFCEDFRIEKNDKKILIGVYDNVMLINHENESISLPNFVVIVTARSSIEHPVKNLSVLLDFGGSETLQTDPLIISEEKIREGMQYLEYKFLLRIQNHKFSAGKNLECKVIMDKEMYMAGQLFIDQAPVPSVQ